METKNKKIIINYDDDNKLKQKKRNFENTLDYYSEDITKKVVGKLFEDYVKEDEENYFTESKEKYSKNPSDEHNTSEEYFDDLYEDIDEEDDYYEDEEDDYEEDEEDDYEEVKPKPVKTKPVKKINYDDVKTYSPRRSRGRIKSDSAKKVSRAKPIPSERNVNKTKPKTKKHNLDYNNNFINDEDMEISSGGFSGIRVFISIAFIVMLCVLAFFAYKVNGLSSKLEEAEAKIKEISSDKTAEEYEEEIKSLYTQLNALKSEDSSEPNSDNGSNSDTDSNTDTSQITTTPTEYIVKKGDNLSKISKNVYGDRNLYNKIAEANNISDGANLYVGQKLIIPPK